MHKLLILTALLLSCGVSQAGEVLIGETLAIQTLILEAQGEGYEGMVAVGEVVRNRAFKGSRTFEQVVMAYKQFSCWNDPLESKSRLSRVSGQTWQVASRAWYASESTNKTFGATHYHNDKVLPKWARGKRPTVVIGHHLFYKGIN